MDKDVVMKECKFVIHLPKLDNVEDDIHIIKEHITYTNGTVEPNLKILLNFKRPFWITKPHYQNHKDKKESEEIAKLNKYMSTQNDLYKEIATRLGSIYIGSKSMRDVAKSPYLYGTDIDSCAIIKKMYKDKYPEAVSNNTLAVLDIEADVDTGELLMISVARKDEVYIGILESFLKGRYDVIKQLNYLYDKYIPKTEYNKNTKPTFEIFKTEIDIVKSTINKLHLWKTDFVAIWNIDYDIPFILNICNKYHVDPKDIFSDPNIPKEYRYFNYKQGTKQKLTESGVYKPINPEEQWHVVITPASHFWIDAMCTHRYVRVGGKSVPGGYSLNNILEKELGSNLKKLKFEEEETMDITGVDWHKYMVANKPLEYIIYNVWDTMSMLELDNKTKDLAISISALSGISSFTIFNSGPKKIVDDIHFFYLDNKRVLGVKEPVTNGEKLLGLDDWIVMLNTELMREGNGKFLKENKNMSTNIRTHVFDMDYK